MTGYCECKGEKKISLIRASKLNGGKKKNMKERASRAPEYKESSAMEIPETLVAQIREETCYNYYHVFVLFLFPNASYLPLLTTENQLAKCFCLRWY